MFQLKYNHAIVVQYGLKILSNKSKQTACQPLIQFLQCSLNNPTEKHSAAITDTEGNEYMRLQISL